VTQKKASPALQLVRLVYTEGQKATGHSWTQDKQGAESVDGLVMND